MNKKALALSFFACLSFHEAFSVKSLAFAETLEQSWRPVVEFSDRLNGKIQLRRHPLSPTSCGIDIIEVGIKNEEDSQFEPHLALLRDTYDKSYPGIAPKVRRIYSYNMPVSLLDGPSEAGAPDSEQDSVGTTALPPVIVDTDEVKRQIMAKLLFALTRTAITSMPNLVASGAVLTVDQFVDVYLRKRAYFRARAMYLLKILDVSQRSDLDQYFNPGELERLIAVGQETEYKDLLITKSYEEFVYMAQNDDVRSNRVRNFANLLSALNREGLVAQPLFRDFVMVYYDPKKTYARKIDLTYTDLINSPEAALVRHNPLITKEGLVPMGIYAIGNNVDRLLKYDFLDPHRLHDRKWIQYLSRLGEDIGTAFIPFPFSLMIRGTKLGIEFVLNKQGQNVLADSLKTEGELLALLDSGLVTLDPALTKEVRQELESHKNQALTMNVFMLLGLGNDTGAKLADYRKKHSEEMTHYLKYKSSSFCKEINSLREAEFQSEYLGFFESFGRKFSSFLNYFGLTSSDKFAAKRKQIILARAELYEARETLSHYNPYIYFQNNELLMHSLEILGQAKDPSDVGLLTKLLDQFVDPDLITATIKAITLHGDGHLAQPLMDYLEKFDHTQLTSVPLAVGDAITALGKLDRTIHVGADDAMVKSIEFLKRYQDSKSKSLRNIAAGALSELIEQREKFHRS